MAERKPLDIMGDITKDFSSADLNPDLHKLDVVLDRRHQAITHGDGAAMGCLIAAGIPACAVLGFIAQHMLVH